MALAWLEDLLCCLKETQVWFGGLLMLLNAVKDKFTFQEELLRKRSEVPKQSAGRNLMKMEQLHFRQVSLPDQGYQYLLPG